METIETWQERTGNHQVRPGSVKHMIAEIADLRAALEESEQSRRDLLDATNRAIGGDTFMGEPVIAQRAASVEAKPVAVAGHALVPKWAGSFSSFQQWVNKAQSWLASPDHRRAMCVDAMGRRCAIGADFMRARDESTFPVHFFWECEVAAPPPQPDSERDAARMDWLVQKIVDVRAELRYGSKFLFTSQAKYDDEEFVGTTLREQIDAAMAAQQGEKE